MARLKITIVSRFFAVVGLLMGLLVTGRPANAAGPTAQPPYSLSVFAKSANGYSQPDSIIQWRDRVFVAFQNHAAKDGSDHKFSTIVEYHLDGKATGRTFSVPGHNDGLRVVGEDNLWSLQNEDGNPNLVVIDLESGHQKLYTFPTPHGGGYDDIIVKDGKVYITASNPNLTSAGINIFPALVRATLHDDMVELDPVLMGDASAVDLPTGKTVTLNLTDPDSLTIDPRGNIVLDSQSDSVLVFIAHPGTASQQVGQINITSGGAAITVDDTAFAPAGQTFLLVSDVKGNTIYRLDLPVFGFEPGTAYSASDTAGIVGVLDLDNGVVTPIVTGLGSGRGMTFVMHKNEEREN